jgi:glyoxylase-like metal-dependent hydrolase (beta-lactamase superfamily II)/rhodanese-related sulfurtransferase
VGSERTSYTVDITIVETPSLGDRSYLITDGRDAGVIDPQRDLDRIESILDERGLRLTHVFETHLHNDYVTGGFALAQQRGAAYVVSADDEVAFERTAAHDGDEFAVGSIVVRAVHTPGHTPTHLSYVAVVEGTPQAVFTGGSLLFGTVGRTDLISAERTDELTRAQFHSVRRLAAELPGRVAVHPTHGFGSFCSSASTSGSDSSTIDQERLGNLALTVDDEETFVRQLLQGLTAYPRYYAHMASRNRQGPTEADLTPPAPVDPAELRRRIHAGEWVVDLRSRKAFARGHVAGTVNVEGGDSFVTYLGWTMRWGTPVTLVGDTREEVAEAQRQMARIGIDRPAGAAEGGLEVWGAGGDIRGYRSASFADLAAARAAAEVVVLDVRRDDEWAEGRIPDAVHIPLHEIEARLDEVPEGEVWVHCATGYRAAIAASLLDRAGRTVVAIDDQWDNAKGYPALEVARGDGVAERAPVA